MAFLDQENTLWQTLSGIADDECLSIYDIERIADNSLRIFIEKAKRFSSEENSKVENQQARVTSEDCARLCRRLMLYFQAQGSNFGLSEPEIEVSSPGVNRRLRLNRHFLSAKGERVKIISKLENPVCIGILELVDDHSLTVSDEKTAEKIKISFPEIRNANVEFKF